MTVRKPKARKHWHFEFQHNGQRHSKGGFETKQEALEAETLHRKMLRKQSGDTTLAYLIIMRLNEIKARCSVAYYIDNVRILNRFINYLNGTVTMVSEIDRECVESFLGECYPTPGAYNYCLKVVRSLFNYGIFKMMFDKNPSKSIHRRAIDKKKKHIPTKEELEKVINLLEGDDKIFLLTLKNTVARVGEIYALTWGDIDFPNRTITLWTRKKRGGARTPRTLPMTDELFKALSTLEIKGEYVFINVKTHNRFYDKKKLLIELCKRANVRRFGFHSIRHLGASTLARKGVPLSDIQEILGHESVTTTAIYIQSIVGSISKSIHLLNE